MSDQVKLKLKFKDSEFEAEGPRQFVEDNRDIFLDTVEGQDTKVVEKAEEPKYAETLKEELRAALPIEVAGKIKEKSQPKKPRSSYETPRGLNNILNMAAKFMVVRARVLQMTGQTKPYGGLYGRTLQKFLEDENIVLNPAHRAELATIAKNLEQIRPWALANRDLLENLSMSGLIYNWHKWKKRGSKPTPAPKPVLAKPELRKAAPVDTSTTLAFKDGKLQRLPTEEVIQPSPTGKVVMEEKQTDTPITYGSFWDVDIENLNAYDKRVLRRFTDVLLNMGLVEPDLSEAKIAGAIRDIKGKEGGDTPPCAAALVRLGVISGGSGVYKLRPEYVRWANMAPAL